MHGSPTSAGFGSLKNACLAAALASGLIGCGTLDSSNRRPPREELLTLRITELHYHPLDEAGVVGDEYEFIEIRNTGTADFDLSKVGFTDGVDYVFPEGSSLAAGEYLVLASNPERFEERYGFAPFGAYAGRLNNAGEKVELSDLPAESVIASVEYSDDPPWPTRADGQGPSLVPVTSEATGAGGEAWRASFAIHGSPGKADPAAVLVNEVSSRPESPASDAIELFNPNQESVDIGGWYLTDKRTDPMKYRIPAGTVLAPGAYKVFDEGDFNADPASPVAFSLADHGGEAYLSADSTGCRGGYCHGFAFGEIESGGTFGRHVNGTGEEHFVAQKSPTLGSANSGPRVGPLVFTEVMYRPPNDSDEYVEIANISDKAVDLFDPENPANTWKVKGLNFDFPPGITLEPKEVVLVLDAAAPVDSFRTAHGLPASLRIFQGAIGLANSTDSLYLQQPMEPYTEGGESVVPFMVVDKLTYKDSSPWPVGADGGGQALVRKDLRTYGDDPANWNGADPTPGKLEP